MSSNYIDVKSDLFDWAIWFQWLMATSIAWVLGRFLIPNLSFAVIGIALGIMQWLVLQQRFKKFYWWIISTIVGWVCGSILIITLIPSDFELVAGIVIGLTLGISQWLLLKQEVYFAAWWIVMNIVAWTTGMALLPGILLTGVIVGLITATTLGLLLKFPKTKTIDGQEIREQ